MDATTQKILDDFSRELDAIEERTPMLGSYARVEPQVVVHEQSGHRIKAILYHEESKAWYGVEKPDFCLSYCRQARLLRPNDIVLDFGCNSGYLTAWFAKECPDGEVHAFDPYPWNAASTRAHAALNGLANVKTYEVGVGSKDREVRALSYSSKTFNAEAPHLDHRIDLTIWDVRRLKRLRPTFAKIDIEGAEHELARSEFPYFPTLERGYVEMHPPFISAAGADPRDFLESMREAGFEIRYMHPYGTRLPENAAYEVALAPYWFQRDEAPTLKIFSKRRRLPPEKLLRRSSRWFPNEQVFFDRAYRALKRAAHIKVSSRTLARDDDVRRALAGVGFTALPDYIGAVLRLAEKEGSSHISKELAKHLGYLAAKTAVEAAAMANGAEFKVEHKDIITDFIANTSATAAILRTGTSSSPDRMSA